MLRVEETPTPQQTVRKLFDLTADVSIPVIEGIDVDQVAGMALLSDTPLSFSVSLRLSPSLSYTHHRQPSPQRWCHPALSIHLFFFYQQEPEKDATATKTTDGLH